VAPPQVAVWHRLWVAELQVRAVPPLHRPAAPAAPQPAQVRPVISWFASQLSAHGPSEVKHPRSSSQPAWQHWLPAPVPQVDGVSVQVQELQTSPVPLHIRVQLTG
jgi:hypothetical protein